MASATVIGAGFGGIAAALRLRAAGFQVQLFDNHAELGGRAGVYRDGGYTFDAGPTVITAPFLFDELFSLFGKHRAGYVTFREVFPWYRIRFADGRTFNYGGTEEQTLAEIRRFAPGDVDGYRRMLRQTEQIYQVGFEQLGSVPFHSLFRMLSVLPKMARLRSDRSVYSFVSRYLKDESLRRVFSFQPLLVGGNPFTTTSIYSLIQHLERRSGVHFAMGGTAALVSALGRLMEEVGVQIRLGQPVRQLLVHAGSAQGVVLADGSVIRADVVVSNVDPPTLYKRLIPATARRKWTDRRLASCRYSMGLFVLYLGLRTTYPDLAHHTILLGRDYQKLLQKIFQTGELSGDFSLYLHAPTRTDPSLAPPGCESLYALVPVPNLQANIDWHVAGPQLQDAVLSLLGRTVCPNIHQFVATSFYVTPEHFRDSLLTEHGSGFSLQPTLFQSAYFRFHNRSEDVRNLYLVGAGTHPGAGLPGVLCSAKVLAHYLPEMRRAASGQRTWLATHVPEPALPGERPR